MALGFSGSNGGISPVYHMVDSAHIGAGSFKDLPIEVSYFVNNVCNLSCRHCYVGYDERRHAISYETWEKVFTDLIEIGALTFGNVGKEPLKDWELTRRLLSFFQGKQSAIPALRYGLVTNGLLLTEQIISELVDLTPTYIDISLDGMREAHDHIRGTGTYDKLMANLERLTMTALADRIFISFTLNRVNQEDIADVARTISGIGIKNMLLSPYVTLDRCSSLYLSDEEMADIITRFVQGKTLESTNACSFNFYVKADYTTSKGLMEQLKQKELIRLESLYMDEYGVVFCKIPKGDSTVIVNYLPYDNTFIHAIRISHDGYVSGCMDMFHSDFASRAIGNVNESPIGDMLLKKRTEMVSKF